MKVYNRYNAPTCFPRFITGETKTEIGLSTPLAVLAERFKNGKEVPRLNGNIDMSIPFQMRFGYDLNDKYELLSDFSTSLNDFAQRKHIDELEKKLKDTNFSSN